MNDMREETRRRPQGGPPLLALATVRIDADGTYRGTPVPAAVRATVVLDRAAGRWQLVRVHMSFIAGTPGAPPVPGRA